MEVEMEELDKNKKEEVLCVCDGCGYKRVTFVGDCCVYCMTMHQENTCCQGRYVAVESLEK
ncbi:MAG TPA: hypothetical protein DEA43_02465 [Candidatus Moranbacteria bacterium]|nr:MAG: hypothetical protein UR95_C0001G0036 [Parcubacteria group bacterium GW2011_GWC1_36_108]KKQ00708.1 MAG: hypothetical protein US09_C0007G0039 [Candidatus Moranbacteria bacterium GW2011_GWD1_36_198]KKQ40429.1 MAG: hypothetical protein US57_C0001G0039 [Candidatus Moranbacteria bacterium GW2011_GWC2_37_73]HAS00137.1 hypothetical protein [Candidatus Moranbacteria bacterium]HBI50411.1 hypothetical protein [Candidatus Moranbacteria bacterium]